MKLQILATIPDTWYNMPNQGYIIAAAGVFGFLLAVLLIGLYANIYPGTMLLLAGIPAIILVIIGINTVNSAQEERLTNNNQLLITVLQEKYGATLDNPPAKPEDWWNILGKENITINNKTKTCKLTIEANPKDTVLFCGKNLTPLPAWQHNN